MNRHVAPVRISRRQFLMGQAALFPWLAVAWNWRPDYRPLVPETAAGAIPGRAQPLCSAELRHLYPPTEAGHIYAGSAPVADMETALERLATFRSHLAEWLSKHRESIEAAIRAPDIVYRRLPYRSSVGHYQQMYAVPDPVRQDRYVAVTLSLAGLPGQKGSGYHKLERVFPARFDYFWTRNAHGEWELKEKWLRAA
jgi:hypothetical protein